MDVGRLGAISRLGELCWRRGVCSCDSHPWCRREDRQKGVGGPLGRETRSLAGAERARRLVGGWQPARVEQRETAAESRGGRVSRVPGERERDQQRQPATTRQHSTTQHSRRDPEALRHERTAAMAGWPNFAFADHVCPSVCHPPVPWE